MASQLYIKIMFNRTTDPYLDSYNLHYEKNGPMHGPSTSGSYDSLQHADCQTRFWHIQLAIDHIAIYTQLSRQLTDESTQLQCYGSVQLLFSGKVDCKVCYQGEESLKGLFFSVIPHALTQCTNKQSFLGRTAQLLA